MLMVLFIYPITAFVGAYAMGRKEIDPSKKGPVTATLFYEYLLEPQDWFSYWRINSRLAGYHGLVTKAKEWNLENKWLFLEQGEQAGIPVSPYMKTSSIVVKDKNEEGGMGIYFFKDCEK